MSLDGGRGEEEDSFVFDIREQLFPPSLASYILRDTWLCSEGMKWAKVVCCKCEVDEGRRRERRAE